MISLRTLANRFAEPSRQGLSVFVTGTNLTHRPQISYTGSPKFPEDISYSVRKFSFGVDYSF